MIWACLTTVKFDSYCNFIPALYALVNFLKYNKTCFSNIEVRLISSLIF